MTKQDYIKTYSTIAQKAGKAFGINPTVILAQSAHESGWGSSTNVKQANNFFGVTAAGSTNQYWGGKSRTASTGLKFRVYTTPTDSFMDFARLIKSKYPKSAGVSTNVNAYAKSIAQSPYISESNGDNRSVYESAIISISKDVKSILGNDWEDKVMIAGGTAIMIGVLLGFSMLMKH
jgi:peptidoglycan hydrolase FlgJ